MNDIEPINQTKLFGLDRFINEFIDLENNNNLPNKILLSGYKGIGKSTLAYHLINYILSKDEKFNYDTNEFKINIENQSFKTTINRSNPNITIIDIDQDKKLIDIDQIRTLIKNLNKSSLNDKPRFVLIDNLEFLNVNSANALLKILEEPSLNTFFILINSNKRIPKTLASRCTNFKIKLNNKECLEISDNLLNGKLYEKINMNLINYYSTPGNIYNICRFAEINKYDFSNVNLKEFLKIIIRNKHYKDDAHIRYLIYDFIEFHLRQISLNFSSQLYDKCSYFLKKISDTKKFNLYEDSLFLEFEEQMLNG